MEKNQNPHTGEREFRFSREEWKKIKIAGALAGAAVLACVAAAGYSAYALGNLRAENDLYRNQLQMSEEKMQKLSAKLEGMEKITEEIQSMTGRNGNTQSAGGAGAADNTGGASTVPDKAKEVKTAATPGALLSILVSLEEAADQDMKTLIGLRSDLATKSVLASAIYQTIVHTTPSIWPVIGEISSPFGWRVSPGGIGSTYHEGLDIAADYGTPVHVTADGTVTRAGWVDGYGYLVEVRHADGFTTRYGHNSAILVYEGQELKQGDIVSLMGSTGNSTGLHVHYEVRLNGAALDPSMFLGNQ